MIVIIGAGPTGLAAGWELKRQGCKDFVILEKNSSAGGLSGSTVDANGFTWDQGGHVVFSHYGEFDKLLTEMMGDDVEHHDRTSFIDHKNTLVPYPFQDHPRYLNSDDKLRVISGVIEANKAKTRRDNSNLDVWAKSTFGNGVYELFFKPYNEKVWSTPLEDMSTRWIEDRVSVPNLEKLLRNITHDEDTAWGPNSTFVFPSAGGTGEIWRRLALRLSDHIYYNTQVVEASLKNKSVTFSSLSDQNRSTVVWESLISTMPLDRLVERIDDLPQSVKDLTKSLRHNKVMIVGIGVKDSRRPSWSWNYYPQSREKIPFYRVTNFAKYAKSNAPKKCSSYMCEISFSAEEQIPCDQQLISRTIAALLDREVMRPAKIMTTHTQLVPYAYPVPTLDRDKVLKNLLTTLDSHEVLSRGRFGSWRYEIGNQDHSAMQGLESARRALNGTSETVIWENLL